MTLTSLTDIYLRFGRASRALLLLLPLALCLTGCVSEEPGSLHPDDGRHDQSAQAFLSLRVSVNNPLAETGTRASGYDFELPTEVCELIGTLRVIVVSEASGNVEVNRLYDFGSNGCQQFTTDRFPVTANDRKRIYLYANVDDTMLTLPEGASGFGEYPVGTPYPAAMDEIRLPASGSVCIDNSGEKKRFIPMSESFLFDIGEPLESGDAYSGSFFLTRALSKFSFEIDSKSDLANDVRISEITIHDMTDTGWLLPHATSYNPEKYTPSAEKYEGRQITAFETPADLQRNDVSILLPDDALVWSGSTQTATAPSYSPGLYFTESAALEKGFRISVKARDLKSTDKDGKPLEIDLGTGVLDNLPSLPRNTHAVVKMRLTGHAVTLQVDLVPYKSVVLKPGFGLDIKTSRQQ